MIANWFIIGGLVALLHMQLYPNSWRRPLATARSPMWILLPVLLTLVAALWPICALEIVVRGPKG